MPWAFSILDSTHVRHVALMAPQEQQGFLGPPHLYLPPTGPGEQQSGGTEKKHCPHSYHFITECFDAHQTHAVLVALKIAIFLYRGAS